MKGKGYEKSGVKGAGKREEEQDSKWETGLKNAEELKAIGDVTGRGEIPVFAELPC